MVRILMAVLAVGVVGFAVSSILFSFLIPMLTMVLKVAVVVGVGYLILRLISPECADKLKNVCCGGCCKKSSEES